MKQKNIKRIVKYVIGITTYTVIVLFIIMCVFGITPEEWASIPTYGG